LNLTDYTYLLNKPDAINEKHAESLEKVMDEFPYFQSARVMRLKHLYNQDSYKYNHALKVSAAYTTSYLMTETLAKVYLEQKKYQKQFKLMKY
jgi:hypothetical protein